jgi:hypothetical protein
VDGDATSAAPARIEIPSNRATNQRREVIAFLTLKWCATLRGGAFN